MNKRNIHIVALACLLFSLGCSSDFLDKQPLDQITTGNFYNTASDANLAVLSCYSVLHGTNWYGKSWMITEIPSDNTTTGGNDPDFSPIDNFTINADNIPNTEFWTEHFKLVTLANQVITFVPDIDMLESQKSLFISEAKFLRAFAYFDLVRIYGEVPIVTELPSIDADLFVSRNPVDEVYEFIIEDLQAGIASLPDKRTGADLGRASADAAKALLAKVFLTIDRNDECMDLCRELIASNRYKLMEDFADNWLKDVSDNNAESIFQLQYVGCGPAGTGNALQAFFAPWGQGITQNSDGWGSQIPSGPSTENPGTTVKDIFSADDLRKYHSIMSPGDYYPSINSELGGYTYPLVGASRSSINIKKYVIGGGSDVCFMSTPQNFHIIRYADVLLMLAEASCSRNGGITATGDVIEAYNQVRRRAGLSETSTLTIDELFEERRREFVFENQRWFDLLRTGNIQEIMLLHGKQMQDFNVLFPIPSPELAINTNLTQNPGY